MCSEMPLVSFVWGFEVQVRVKAMKDWGEFLGDRINIKKGQDCRRLAGTYLHEHLHAIVHTFDFDNEEILVGVLEYGLVNWWVSTPGAYRFLGEKLGLL